MISDSPDLLMAQVRIFSFFPFSSAKIRENVGKAVREVKIPNENAVKRVENDSSEVHVVHQSKVTVYHKMFGQPVVLPREVLVYKKRSRSPAMNATITSQKYHKCHNHQS